MFRLLKNPFYVYVLGFVLTFFVYSLGWSDIYPSLSDEVKIFLAVTFFISLFLGLCLDALKVFKRQPSLTKQRLISTCFYTILFFYFVEIVVEGDIPLMAKLMGRPGIEYDEFGLPVLHGLLISFHSFLIAHSFSVYMSTKRKRTLRIYLLLYVPAFLILNRSIIVFGLLTSLFIYIHFVGKVKLSRQIKIGILALVALFIFGLVGNLRSGGDYIYTQSKATKDFMKSSIPKEYYWTYLYVASPLANFQNTVNNIKVKEYDFTGFVFYENLPKIISKSAGPLLDVERRDLLRIVPWLTVGTTYGRSFAYVGWYGPYLLFFFNLFLYLLIIVLIPRKSNYHTTSIGILSVIILLSIFTNMMIVTGISFQLAYCVIFAFFSNKKLVFKHENALKGSR